MLKFSFSKIQINKKGRSFLLLPFFVFVVSCYSDLSSHGRVTLHNTTSKDSFIFSVQDEFLQKNSSSKPDKSNPKISRAESKLLQTLLKQKRYCLNAYGTPTFTITSRQEKVYDITFAHLIENNYNARSIAPIVYYGRCKSK